MLKEYFQTDSFLEAFLVKVTRGTCVVINGRVVGISDDTCLHSYVTLFSAAFEANDLPLYWTPSIDDRSEDISRLSTQYGLSEHEVLQQMLDRGQVSRHPYSTLRSLEAKLLQPHVFPALIGNNIKRERKALGWTAKELSERSHLDAHEVKAFEQGGLIIFAEQLIQLSRGLGLESPEKLLEEA